MPSPIRSESAATASSASSSLSRSCRNCSRAADRLRELEEEFELLRAVLLEDDEEVPVKTVSARDESDAQVVDCDAEKVRKEVEELVKERTKYALTLDTMFRGVLFEAKELSMR